MGDINDAFQLGGIKDETTAMQVVFALTVWGCHLPPIIRLETTEKNDSGCVATIGGAIFSSKDAAFDSKSVSQKEMDILHFCKTSGLLAFSQMHSNSETSAYVSITDKGLKLILSNITYFKDRNLACQGVVSDLLKDSDSAQLCGHLRHIENTIYAQTHLPVQFCFESIAIQLHKLFMDKNGAANLLKKKHKNQEYTLADVYLGKVFLFDEFRSAGLPPPFQKYEVLFSLPHTCGSDYGLALRRTGGLIGQKEWLQQNIVMAAGRSYSIKELISISRNQFAAHSLPNTPEAEKLNALRSMSIGGDDAPHAFVNRLGWYVASLLRMVRCLRESGN